MTQTQQRLQTRYFSHVCATIGNKYSNYDANVIQILLLRATVASINIRPLNVETVTILQKVIV